MNDPNDNILTWLKTADSATGRQARDLCAQAAARIEALEAQLAEAKEALRAVIAKLEGKG